MTKNNNVKKTYKKIDVNYIFPTLDGGSRSVYCTFSWEVFVRLNCDNQII